MDDYMEVDFKTYCDKCRYKEKKEYEDPCTDCLELGMLQGTRVPYYYEERE